MGRIMVNGENFSGSDVVANPTLDGGEATLNSIQIDAIKYAVGGGGGGVTITEIFNNSSYQTLNEYQMSESVYNFDFLIFVGQYNIGGNLLTTDIIIPSEFLKETQGQGLSYLIELDWFSNFTQYKVKNPYSSGGDGDIIMYYTDNGSRAILLNVYGVKLSN